LLANVGYQVMFSEFRHSFRNLKFCFRAVEFAMGTGAVCIENGELFDAPV
jgi:hypothetical protein